MEMTDIDKMEKKLFGKEKRLKDIIKYSIPMMKNSIEDRLDRIEKMLTIINVNINKLNSSKRYKLSKELPVKLVENNKLTKKDNEQLSTVAKAVGNPDAMFNKEDKEANIKSRITIWIEEGDNEYSRIIGYTETSKMDGSNRVEAKNIINRKGIMDFTKSEIKDEIKRYYQRLIDQGFSKIK